MKKNGNLPGSGKSSFLKLLLVMRLTFALILLGCLHVSAGGFSQNRISVDFRDIQLKKALTVIEKKSDYRFLYKESLVSGAPLINFSVKDAEVTEVLNHILTNTGLAYELLDNKLVVLKNGARKVAVQQDITITGKVTSTTGESIIGATVSVKGTANAVATDVEGNYRITAPEDATLVISSVGFQTQEVEVNGRTAINISLVVANQDLEQIVVIGYGTAQKRDLTGSIATVKGEEIADKPAANPLSSLQGKVAGLTVINSGRPGAEPDVRIRGTNTINGVKPVYIVDGILNDNINFLNPADIESVEILKDPSSLAIFGVRGANGAIAITTKKARAGQLRVNFNTSVGIKSVLDRMDMADANTFRELYNEQLQNQSSAPFDYTYWTGNTDWQDQIFQNGVLNYNNVSISGASEKNNFYMGLGYINEEGIIKHEQYNKLTININDQLKVTKDLRFGVNFSGYRAGLPDGKNVSSAIRAVPIAPVFGPGSALYHILPDFQKAQVYNPLIDVESQKKTAINTEYRAVGSIYGEIDFLQRFTFKAALYADYGFNTNRSYQPLVIVYNPDKVVGGTNDTLVQRTSVNQGQNIFTKVQQDYLLTYKNKWGAHDLTMLGGFTTYYRSFEGTSSRVEQGNSFPIPNDKRYWYVNQVGDQSTRTSNPVQPWEQATVSYLARALYNYDGKYLVNASFRRDGSSAFPESGRWQNFGAIGLGWVVSREDFFTDQNIFDYLKLRGSWGILGNQNIGDGYRYPFYPTLTSANSGVFGDNVVPALQNEYLPDPNLHWESVHAYEIGVEFNTFNNRLHAEVNYYNKLTKDILVVVPGISGTIPGLSNLGEVANKGVELMLNWEDNITNDISYTLSGNLTTIDNSVKKLSSTGYQIVNGASRTTAGYPIGYFYGYDVIGVYQTDAEILRSPASAMEVHPGDLKYRDVNEDGQITEADRTLIGNPTPDFTYGASMSLQYKGFDLGIELTGVYGNEIFRDWNRSGFAQFNFQEHRTDRWTGPGTSNWEPIIHTGRANNYVVSSYWIEDGSFFRIRNIQLGYDFGKALLDRLKLQSLRVYVNAQNLATFANSTGYTPEIGGSATTFGVDNGTYPVPAIFTFGLNLNF